MVAQMQLHIYGSHCLTVQHFPSTRSCLVAAGGLGLESGMKPGGMGFRRMFDTIQYVKDDFTKSNVKKALLTARKKERIELPFYENARFGEIYHISEFLKHPTGVEAMLNVNVLETYAPIDANTYRCKLPPIQLLNLEVTPVLDLEVNPARESCSVELLSCKFEGSELVENQNKYFTGIILFKRKQIIPNDLSAHAHTQRQDGGIYVGFPTMKNFITWSEAGSNSFLDVDVKLNISLEIYSRPFTMLPVSAVEGPGNLVLQALLDSFVPVLLQQLLKDYDDWINQQCTTSLP